MTLAMEACRSRGKCGLAMIKPADMHIDEPVMAEFDIPDHFVFGFCQWHAPRRA